MLKKAILMLSLVMPFASCQASGDSALSSAKWNYNLAVAAVEEVEERCEKSEVDLPKGKFIGLGVSNDDLKVALQYFYFKSKVDCTSGAVKNFLVASAVLSSLDEEQQEDLQQANLLIVNANVQLARAEVAYNELPESSREALSSVPELNTPFDLLGSVRAIGLE